MSNIKDKTLGEAVTELKEAISNIKNVKISSIIKFIWKLTVGGCLLWCIAVLGFAISNINKWSAISLIVFLTILLCSVLCWKELTKGSLTLWLKKKIIR